MLAKPVFRSTRVRLIGRIDSIAHWLADLPVVQNHVTSARDSLAHTSGHADPNSLVRLAQALNPRMIIPIHTEAPRIMESLVRNVHILHDGDWLTV